MERKGRYHIHNWRDYNKSLIQRGSLTVWFSDDAVNTWLAREGKGQKGHPFLYSKEAILTALMIRSVFHLPLRALEGFLTSVVNLMGLFLPTPSYTQISRRATELGQELKCLSRKKITDLVIDSTGLKLYGEGEWKVRQHGKSKRRTWKKLHLAVCPNSHEIVFEVLTDNSVSDCKVYPTILDAAPSTLERSYGDGAYDTESCYKANKRNGSIPIIPPGRNSIFRPLAPDHWQPRNNAYLEILGLGGNEEARDLWKKLKNYHRRSLGETAMFRFKQLFGSNLKSRDFARQRAEVWSCCLALNRMTELGMPKGSWII